MSSEPQSSALAAERRKRIQSEQRDKASFLASAAQLFASSRPALRALLARRALAASEVAEETPARTAALAKRLGGCAHCRAPLDCLQTPSAQTGQATGSAECSGLEAESAEPIPAKPSPPGARLSKVLRRRERGSRLSAYERNLLHLHERRSQPPRPACSLCGRKAKAQRRKASSSATPETKQLPGWPLLRTPLTTPSTASLTSSGGPRTGSGKRKGGRLQRLLDKGRDSPRTPTATGASLADFLALTGTRAQ